MCEYGYTLNMTNNTSRHIWCDHWSIKDNCFIFYNTTGDTLYCFSQHSVMYIALKHSPSKGG